MRLTFRVTSTTFWRGLITVVLVTIGLVLPLAMGVWYVYGSGLRMDHRRNFRQLSTGDPIVNARNAVERGDLRFYALRDGLDVEYPGIATPTREHIDRYGNLFLLMFRGDNLTTEDQQLNAAVRDYARAYNQEIARHTAATPAH